jgi:hypothetical protein
MHSHSTTSIALTIEVVVIIWQGQIKLSYDNNFSIIERNYKIPWSCTTMVMEISEKVLHLL